MTFFSICNIIGLERMIILGRVIDLTGQRFGKLTVIEKSDIKNGSVLWKGKCDCGNYTEVITALIFILHSKY